MTPDQINAGFEGGGAVLLCMNIRRLYKDKRLAGVSLFPTIWWNLWGVWNVYFYYAIGTPLSFYAGIGVLVANTVWVALALYYIAREKIMPPETLTDKILDYVAMNYGATAREIAEHLDARSTYIVSVAWVSGLLSRLHRQDRISRGNIQVLGIKPGPWRYAPYGAALRARGLCVQLPEERDP